MPWIRCNVAASRFYLGWTGEPGKGRALGVSSVKFTGEVLKKTQMATYEINMKKIFKKRRYHGRIS